MKPILLDFPSEITTNRLFIRMPQFNDGKQLYESIKYSQEQLRKWLPFAKHEMTPESVEEENRQAHIRFLQRSQLRMYIFEKATGRFIGTTGFHNINWDIPRFEIGYWLDSRFTGQGYMTEAVEGLTAYAFEHLKAKRVVITCDIKNSKSKAIPERLGYNLEGILKNQDLSVDTSELTDTMLFAKTVL